MDGERQLIAPQVPPTERGGDKRTVEIRAVVEAPMYALGTRCQWWALPKALPRATTIDSLVNAPLALLYLGDHHATQVEGERCGVALEHPTTTTVQVDPIKVETLARPRLETSAFYVTIGSARAMVDASRIAYRELIRWTASGIDADLLPTMCSNVRLGETVVPRHTLAASITKSILAAHRS